MKLRYAVARLVPDLIREEFINVGVILQADERVACKFIERIPKSWALPQDIEEDVATVFFLEWLLEIHHRHLQFSGIHGAEIDVGNAFDFDTFLLRLYQTFVSPKPLPRKPHMRSRLHTEVGRKFIQC